MEKSSPLTTKIATDVTLQVSEKTTLIQTTTLQQYLGTLTSGKLKYGKYYEMRGEYLLVFKYIYIYIYIYMHSAMNYK